MRPSLTGGRRIGCSWHRSLVGSCSILEADELGDQSAKVTLVQDEDVIENLSSERSCEAFDECVHVWRSYGRPHQSRTRRDDDASEATSQLGVVITDDDLRRTVHRGGDAGRGRRARTPLETERRTSARNRTPTSRGSAGTWTSSVRCLRSIDGPCTAEPFAYTRGCPT
jgi:hypothetical protein